MRASGISDVPTQIAEHAGAPRTRHFQVLANRELAEHTRHLELAADTCTRDLMLFEIVQRGAVEQHRPARGLDLAADDVQRRGLPCTVRPDQTAQLALAHTHVEAVERLEA